MGFFSNLFSKENKPAVEEETTDEKSMDEAMEPIVEYIKKHYGKKVYRITANRYLAPTRLDSKFGGLPYWPRGKKYPANEKGEKLLLLAQINFSQLRLDDDLLPKNGMLQFFVEASWSYGLKFGDDLDFGYCVVYHPSFSSAEMMGLDELEEAGITANCDLDRSSGAFPFYKELSLAFEPDMDYPTAYSEEMLAAAQEAQGALGLDVSAYGPHEYLTQNLCHDGHKMLGYPTFTQEDPRTWGSPYNTLLFQMDSDVSNEIMWGDGGVGNFFINSEALARADFSDVLYNWDCY